MPEIIIQSLKRNIHAKVNMQQIQVNVLTQVNRSNIIVDNERGVVTIRDVCPIVDDIVMNNILYPAANIDASYKTLEGTLAPLGHPQDDDGNYISAKTGPAINGFYAGAYNKNVRKIKDRVFMDVEINVKMAMGSNRGPELMDRINKAVSGENTDPIHVSTGLMLVAVEAEGMNNKGVEYEAIAEDMDFDHNAILLDEPGAGTPADGVGMMFNSSGIGLKSKVQFAKLEVNQQVENNDKPKVSNTFTAKLIDRLAKKVIEGNNNNHANSMPNSQEEDGEMKKLIDKLLAANCGKTETELSAMAKDELQAFAANNMDMKDMMGMMMEFMGMMDKMNGSMDKMNGGYKEMGERMNTMQNSLQANAEQEHEKLVANAAAASGIDADHLKGMTAEGLLAITAKNSSSEGIDSALGDQSADPKFDCSNMGAPE